MGFTTMEWTEALKNDAARQGWALTAFWDQAKQRIEMQIFKDDTSNIFTTDEAARGYVAEQTKRGDKLAVLATQSVFQSKLGAEDRRTNRGKK
jgi:hypothetical protein